MATVHLPAEQPPLTADQQTAYAAAVLAGRPACPYCGSAGVEHGPFDVRDAHAYQEVSCSDCDAAWEDDYAFAKAQEM